MKKFFLILCATAATAVMAQTKENPIVLTEGVTSTYEVEEAWTNVWYQFTAEADGSYYVNSDACYEYIHPGSVDADNTTYGDPAAVDLTAGSVIYIQAYSPSSTTYDMTVTKLTDQGRSADDPVVIPEEGGTFFAMCGNYKSFYFSYTATKDALLKMTSSYAEVYIDGAQVDYKYNNSTWDYEYKLQVAAGQTYSIVYSGYSDVTVTFSLTELVPGSWDTPFTMVEGENKIDGELTSAWLVYKDTQSTGKVSLSSTNATSIDYLIVFDSEYYASMYAADGSYSDYAVAKTQAGSLDAEWIKEYTYTTYYIFVSKAKSPFATKLNLAIAPFEAGDVMDTAIEMTLPYAGQQTAAGKKWYKVTCPQSADNKMFVVQTTSEVKNNATQIAIVNEYGYNYAEGNTSAKYETDCQYSDQTIYVTVNNQEEGALSFAVSLEEITPGETMSKPIELASGDTYTFDAAKNLYFSFTGTEDNLLSFAVSSEAMYVTRVQTIPYINPVNTTEGQTFYFNSGNATSTFLVTGAQAGDSFTFTESAYPPGKSMTTAIEMNGTYTLDESTYEIWLKYNVLTDCILHLSANVDWSYGNNIGYRTSTTENYDTSIANYNTYVYDGRATGVAGGTLWIHVTLEQPCPGKTITVEELQPAEGEVIGTAITVYKDQTFTIPAGATLWYKFEALVTDYCAGTLATTSSVSISKADNYDDAVDGNTYYLYAYDGYHYEFYLAEGWNYVKVYNYQMESVDLTFGGQIAEQPVVGIESVNAEASTSAYSLDGRHQNGLQRGFNIVNGQKLLVK